MTKTYHDAKQAIKYQIREAVENPKNWVIDVFYEDRKYPNIISGQYKTIRDCRLAISEHQNTGKFCFWGNI